jgi:hypothetical protein
VQQRDELRGAQAPKRRFELERLVDRLTDELLDDRLSPGTEGAFAESPAETLDAGDADAQQLAGIAVQHMESGLDENLRHFVRLPRLDVVIAKHGRHWNPQRRQFLRQHARFFGQTVVGQVACQQQQVGRLGNAREQRLKGALRGFGAVEVR